jgi:DNA-binding CsgD family transcriptional regulator
MTVTEVADRAYGTSGASGAVPARGRKSLELVGRDQDLSVIQEFVDELPAQGGTLLLSGAPGAGKSALLNAAAETAAAAGIRVLRAAGAEFEDQSFSALNQLLLPLRGELNRLDGLHREALDVALGFSDGLARDQLVVSNAVLALLGHGAADCPLLVIVDNLQWADRASALVLGSVARRLPGSQVGLLAAERSGSSRFFHPDERAHEVPPLDENASVRLVRNRFPDLVPSVRQRIVAEAQGNPLALLELPSALSNLQRDGLAALPAVLPLSPRLRALWRPPLSVTVSYLLLLAVLEGTGNLSLVQAAAGRGYDLNDLAEAEHAGLVDVDEAAGRVSFAHPLTRSAVYQAASVADRHAAHAALAGVLAHDPDRQAWHRAAATSGPAPEVAADLEHAARRARGRGCLPDAATAFERAAALAADPAHRGALLLSAAEAARELGQTYLVTRLLHQADTAPLTPDDRAYAMWLGDALSGPPAGDPIRIRALIETATGTAVAKDTQLALRLLSAAAARCHWADLGGQEAGDLLLAADRAGASPDDPLLLHIQAHAAPLDRGPAVLDHLASALSPDGPRERTPEALYLLGTAAYLAGDYHAAGSLLGACAVPFREHGRLRALTHVLAVRAWAAVMTSDYRTAGPAAEEAGRLAAETAQPLWEALTWAAQAALAAVAGDQRAVDRLTVRVEEVMLPIGAAEPLSLIQYTRGLAALGQGRHADAWADLHRIYEPGDPAHNHRHMCGAIADLAEAAVHTGHRDVAQRILDQLRARLQRAPWLRTAAACAEALLADDDHAEAAYQHALDEELAAWPLARTRLRLAYGEWLRRQRRPADSRPHLRAARGAFDALGAAAWADRARRELRAAGETSGHRATGTTDQLTPQELQITRLAAAGLSNREIGQRLYLSHRTIESHLYRVYPKLGITSRVQLSRALKDLTAVAGIQ